MIEAPSSALRPPRRVRVRDCRETRLYQRRDGLESAQAAYREALAIDDTRVDVRVGLAGVLRLKRDLDAAKQQIDAACKGDPKHAGVAIELAAALDLSQEFEGAEEAKAALGEMGKKD